ncbi:MAG: hypothetical protein E7B34_28790, partial [Hafnia alvei]|nr:hypothetical protein [Hafnia alvei]
PDKRSASGNAAVHCRMRRTALSGLQGPGLTYFVGLISASHQATRWYIAGCGVTALIDRQNHTVSIYYTDLSLEHI